MPQAVVFAVTEDADAFAMRTVRGVVLTATSDPGWTPRVGARLGGYSHSLGPCTATDIETGQSISLIIKNSSDIPRPSAWGELL